MGMVFDHFQQPETSSQPFLSEEDVDTQAETTENKIAFPKEVGFVCG